MRVSHSLIVHFLIIVYVFRIRDNDDDKVRKTRGERRTMSEAEQSNVIFLF